jgi:hypothetical protein
MGIVYYLEGKYFKETIREMTENSNELYFKDHVYGDTQICTVRAVRTQHIHHHHPTTT